MMYIKLMTNSGKNLVVVISTILSFLCWMGGSFALAEESMTPVTNELYRSFSHNMTPVSEGGITCQVSLINFNAQRISKIKYNCTVYTKFRPVIDNLVPSYGSKNYSQYISVRHVDVSHELKFMPNNGKTIRFVETMSGGGGTNVTHLREVEKDGRYVDKRTDEVGKYSYEIDSRYPTNISYSVGTKWSQRYAADPSLNSGGIVTARLDIVNTFYRDKERYVRVHRFHAYNLNFQSRLVCNVIDEIWDIQIDTGVVVEQSVITRKWIKSMEQEAAQPLLETDNTGQALKALIETDSTERIVNVAHL